MMVSMESYLAQVKEKAERWQELPVIQWIWRGALYFGGGFALSGVGLWGQMQPVAIGLTVGSGGWRCVCAALGAALGYRMLWKEAGLEGILWTLGALSMTAVMPLMESGRRLRNVMAVGAACIVAGTGMAFQIRTGGTEPGIFLLRMLLAGGCAYWGASAVSGRERVIRWLGWGFLVLGLTGMYPALGYAVSGMSAVSVPLPGALMVGLGVDLGAAPAISLTAVSALAFFLRRLLPDYAAPSAACVMLMLLQRCWAPGVLLAVGAGSIVGALLPRRVPVRSGSLGGVQVRLEQTARTLTRFQRQLLAYVAPAPDVSALTAELRKNTCDSCELRRDCGLQERVNDALVAGNEPFLCRRPQRVLEALRSSQRELRRIRASRAVQEEYRMALVQQYGFLVDTLHRLEDQLAERHRKDARFRIQLSARSRGQERADGDVVSAFQGTQCRFYIVLCDGMGTGDGAEAESRGASRLIREMLTAGMPPESVLGSLNSQMALTNHGGAVTVDLAEIRLDSGRVWLYKWGAGPSLLLRKRTCVTVGASGPPPGLGVRVGRENVSHVAMDREEVLLLLSDGICADRAPEWAAFADQAATGELAERVLADGGSGEDDATAVAVRLIPCEQ